MVSFSLFTGAVATFQGHRQHVHNGSHTARHSGDTWLPYKNMSSYLENSTPLVLVVQALALYCLVLSCNIAFTLCHDLNIVSSNWTSFLKRVHSSTLKREGRGAGMVVVVSVLEVLEYPFGLLGPPVSQLATGKNRQHQCKICWFCWEIQVFYCIFTVSILF